MQVLKGSEQLLHDVVDVLLEGVYLACLVVILEVLDHLLHVVLQIDGEVLLGAEAGLHKAVVENDVDARGAALIVVVTCFLGGSVRTGKNNLAFFAGLVLKNK